MSSLATDHYFEVLMDDENIWNSDDEHSGEQVPTVFDSYADALEELVSFFNDCKFSVEGGFMTDMPDIEDFKIIEVSGGNRIEHAIDPAPFSSPDID